VFAYKQQIYLHYIRRNIVLNRLVKFGFLALIVVVFSLIAAAIASAQSATATPQDNSVVQAKISSAMSAGPSSITQDATIFDRAFDADGHFVVLRQGNNGWYCLPDIAASPQPDPQCIDQTWLDAIYAFRAGKPVVITQPGIAYMLAGGDHPSYTDPKAATPPPSEDWHQSGPHLMILLPGTDLTTFSACTDAMMDSDNSCAMFPNTPLAHLMVPVGDMASMGAQATPAASS
jgi:hypothetical protein